MPPGGRIIRSYVVMSDNCHRPSPVQARSERGSNSTTLEMEAEVCRMHGCMIIPRSTWAASRVSLLGVALGTLAVTLLVQPGSQLESVTVVQSSKNFNRVNHLEIAGHMLVYLINPLSE
jgi:hypothetical protein